ncbi:hypothetical protein [Brachyspira pulli]|uniref:hypothetical protein n=1 Tax=Brachyspira pulli TaxID=310721 RepID=UPI00300457F7
MNKKLLLILSILMSLSLLSCAKSVTAPENVIEGVTPGQEVTKAEIENELKKIGIIAGTSFGNPSFDFTSIWLMEETSCYEAFQITVSELTPSSPSSHSYVLNQLREKINMLSSETITFDANYNWDNEPTIENYPYNLYLTINISSKLLTIPSKLKTVKINLFSYWQN